MLWWIPLFPVAFAGLALLIRPGGWQRPALAIGSAVALLTTLTLLIVAASADWEATLRWSDLMSLQLGLSPVALTTAVLVLAIAIPVLLYAAMHEARRGLSRLLAGLLFFVGSMLVLVLAEDFLTLLIAWELVGISSWLLIAHEWWPQEHGRDANYAFVATRIGDLGLFLAASVIFAATGRFSYGAIGELDEASRSLLTAGVVLAAVSKSAQLPFSPWLFRAMSGPSSVSALLHAATMVASGAYILIRLYPDVSSTPWFGPVVFAVGLITALVAGALAILQVHAKRLAAASTAAQYGFMLVAIGAGYPAVALLHMIAHGAFKASLFLVIGILNHGSGSWRLSDMGLGLQLPVSAAVSAIAVLALMGVPPLGAAWSKEAVTAAAEGLGKVWGLIVILASGITATYALRFQLLAFGRLPDREERKDLPPFSNQRPGATEKIALALLTGMSLLLALFWLPSVQATLTSALDGRLPSLQLWSVLISWLAILSGVYAARLLVQSGTIDQTAEQRPDLLEWFGWTRLLDGLVVRPTLYSARALALVDDHLLDWPVRRAPVFAGRLGRLLRRTDETILDPLIAGFSTAVLRLARQARETAEFLVDGLPEGSSSLTALAGKDARRIQSGLSHQYYLLVCGGLAVLLAVLFITAM